MVHGQKLELSQEAVSYYIKLGVTVTPCEAITTETGQVTEVPPDFEYEDITTDHVQPPYDPESYQHIGGEKCYMVHGQKMPLTQQAVDYYRNIGVSVTPCEDLGHGDPPFPPTTPTPTPTEPSQVNWIPEPFFSFINNVFKR